MLMNPGPFPFMHHDEIGARWLGWPVRRTRRPGVAEPDSLRAGVGVSAGRDREITD